jgi:hypothetical protein
MMYPAGRATRLRPLDIGDVLDETFQVYRRGFMPLITTMAIVLVPSAIVLLVLGIVAGVGAGVGQSMFDRLSREAGMVMIGAGIAAFIFILLLVLISAAAQLIASGACIRIASDVILGQPINIKQAYREAFGSFWRLLLASICVGIPIGVLVLLVCIGWPFAVYVGLGWSLVFPLIMLEGQGAFDSLGRSWDLVAGHRWRLLVIFILLILIQWLLLSIPGFLIGLLSAGAILLSGGSAVVELAMQVVQTTFQTAAQVLFTPVALITTTLLYYDLVVRKEAFDLQQRLPRAEIVPPGYPPYGQQPPQYPQQPPQYPPYGQQPPQHPQQPPQYPPQGPGYPPSPQQPPQTPGYPPYPPPPPQGPPRQ